MNTPLPQLTLREWRLHMAQPVRIAALLGLGVILALIAPFGTDTAMRAFPRLAYWLALVLIGYSVGFFCHIAAQLIAPDSLVTRMICAGALTALGAFSLVYLVNGLSFGVWPAGWALISLAGRVTAIAIIIAVIFQLAYADPRAPDPDRLPALLDRLPFDKRGALVSLSVEDHYVHIRTTNGEEMVLLRLSDAIREVAPTDGLRVHRSHWVALGQITQVDRKGDGAILRMRSGPNIPVSRANMPALKDAGLLPGARNG